MSDTEDSSSTKGDAGGGSGSRSADEISLDMENRDPNDLNAHIQVAFHEVIGEPKGAHSKDCIWRNSYKCFNSGVHCCYTFLTYVCAIPMAFCWGCHFACMTFNHIWYFTPCLISFNINFDCFAKFYSTILHCCCDPWYESLSLMFTRIYVTNVTSGDAYQGKSMTEYNLMKAKGGSSKER